MTKRSKKKNPDPKKVAAIVVGSLGAVALGALAIYAVRSSRRAGLPPAVKQPLPPRANGMPSPDPIAPAKVPPTVTTAASTMAPATPAPSGSATIDYQGSDWVTYGWYTYKGNAPQKMWIRVDWKGKAAASVLDEDEGALDIGPGTAISHAWYLIGPMRWVVIMGENIPMATETLWGIKVDCESPEAVLLPDILVGDSCHHERAKVTTPFQKEGFLNRWIIPVAGTKAARAAADWIDIAYGGGP